MRLLIFRSQIFQDGDDDDDDAKAATSGWFIWKTGLEGCVWEKI